MEMLFKDFIVQDLNIVILTTFSVEFNNMSTEEKLGKEWPIISKEKKDRKKRGKEVKGNTTGSTFCCCFLFIVFMKMIRRETGSKILSHHSLCSLFHSKRFFSFAGESPYRDRTLERRSIGRFTYLPLC